jgi:hypothetical protein
MPITVRFVGSGDSFGSGGCYFYDKPVKWHLNYPDITSHASRVGAKRLILTHMSREMLARAPGGPEECAYDGLVVTL